MTRLGVAGWPRRHGGATVEIGRPAAGDDPGATDTGGALARTLQVEVGSGRVTVRAIGGEPSPP